MTQKSDLPQVNFLRFLTQPLITRRRPLELTYIDYDIIQDEISGMEYFEQNTYFKRTPKNNNSKKKKTRKHCEQYNRIIFHS